MNHAITSLKVLLYINDNQINQNNLSPREIRAISSEIKKLWPPDDYYRVWFDIEEMHPMHDRWEVMFKVVCYYFPAKEETAPIPEVYLKRLVDKSKKFRIYPYTEEISRINSAVVEVAYVVE